MRPPNLRRLSMEDFPDAPSWMPKLLFVLNQFMEQTVSLFNRNISLGDNVQSRTYETQFNTLGAYIAGDFDSLRFTWEGSTIPVIVQIARITDNSGALITTAVGTPQWTYNAGTISVNYISGLANNGKYSVRFLVL